MTRREVEMTAGEDRDDKVESGDDNVVGRDDRGESAMTRREVEMTRGKAAMTTGGRFERQRKISAFPAAAAKNLGVPGRAKVMVPPPLSFRSEARNLVFADRSPPHGRFEISPAGRDDSGGRSR